MGVNNKMSRPVESDSRGVSRVIDESADGTKAIPVVFVQKDEAGGFGYGKDPVAGTKVKNEMSTPIESDSRSTDKVIDEDINGTKAIPFVPVTKNENGEFVYTSIGGDLDDITITWGDVQNKPTEFTPESHSHSISEVNGLQAELDAKADTNHSHSISEVDGLQTELDAKLTASQAAAQADSSAEDIATLVSDFNDLLAKLRTAGILSE